MKQGRLFSAADSVVDLIDHDYNVLTVLSRFSMPLGFGNGMTLAELCDKSGISAEAFLLIINFLLSGEIDEASMARVSAMEIVDFLRNSHEYYLNYKLPHIRANLINALDETHADINPIIVRFFDDYVKLVSRHFDYEEQTVFPYIRALCRGQRSDYRIDVFRRHHDDEVEAKLSELKNIILRYYRTSTPSKMYDVLVDIYNCEEDVKSHAAIENHILIPLIAGREQR